MRVSVETMLPVTADAAWRALLDWERQPTWMGDADRVEVLGDRRAGVGTVIAVRTRVWGVPLFTERLEVVTWDPPRALEMAHRSLVRGMGRWELVPHGDGCRFGWTEDLSLPLPLLGEGILLAYRPFMRRLMRSATRRLRGQLDGHPGPGRDLLDRADERP